MRRLIAIAAATVALAAPGSASANGRCIAEERNFDPVNFECSRSFEVGSEPVTFRALGPKWRAYAASWSAEDGESFTTDNQGCRMYGRYRGLRVRENVCDRELIVTARSLDGPQRVTFEWEGWR
jgi:hypothetical protein